MHVRKILTFVDELRSEAGQPAQIPLRKVAAVAVVKNPFAGNFEQIFHRWWRRAMRSAAK